MDTVPSFWVAKGNPGKRSHHGRWLWQHPRWLPSVWPCNWWSPSREAQAGPWWPVSGPLSCPRRGRWLNGGQVPPCTPWQAMRMASVSNAICEDNPFATAREKPFGLSTTHLGWVKGWLRVLRAVSHNANLLSVSKQDIELCEHYIRRHLVGLKSITWPCITGPITGWTVETERRTLVT